MDTPGGNNEISGARDERDIAVAGSGAYVRGTSLGFVALAFRSQHPVQSVRQSLRRVQASLD